MRFRHNFLNVGLASALAYSVCPNEHVPDKHRELPSRSHKNYSSKITKSAKLMEQIKLKHGLPGVSVAVSVDGEIVWTQGFGYADIENLVECTPDTVFRVASLSKPITTAIVAKLFQSGSLSLDTPISFYVDFPAKFVEDKKCVITCRDILSHSSGIRHYNPNDPSEFYVKTKFADVTSALNIFKNDDLLFVPGSKTNYSTYAWTLLAAVCESVTEKKFTELLTDFFEHLRLSHTFLDNHQPLIFNRTRYYTMGSHREVVNAEYAESTHKYAGGGILSTVGDIVRFGNSMLESYGSDRGYLNPSIVKMLWTPRFKKYGLGWFISPEFPDSTCVYHTGGAAGGSSVVVIIPSGASGVVVCIMTNMENVGLLKTAKKIAFDFANED